MYIPIAGVLNHFPNLLHNILAFISNKKIFETTILWRDKIFFKIGIVFLTYKFNLNNQ